MHNQYNWEAQLWCFSWPPVGPLHAIFDEMFPRWNGSGENANTDLPLGAGLGLIEEHLPNTSGALHLVFNL